MKCKSCEERRRKIREATKRIAAKAAKAAGIKRSPGAAGIKAGPAKTAQELRR